MSALTWKVVGKPSKYRNVADAFVKLRKNQALEVMNGASPQVIDSGVRVAIKKVYDGKIHTTWDGKKVIFWK